MKDQESSTRYRIIIPRYVTHTIVVVVLAGVLMYMLLPASGPSNLGRSNVEKCQKQLKQLGLCIQSYYSDGTSTALPKLNHYRVTSANEGGFGFDGYMLTCPAEHLGHLYHYVWNPKLSGGKWSEWNNPNSALIWDAAPHKLDCKFNVLFGDGHVEEMTPERLKEMTK